ncbi:MAG: hypothetical protein AVDCRST_MAG79-2455, partial [uncultured Thermoleophilia bacterium]
CLAGDARPTDEEERCWSARRTSATARRARQARTRPRRGGRTTAPTPRSPARRFPTRAGRRAGTASPRATAS